MNKPQKNVIEHIRNMRDLKEALADAVPKENRDLMFLLEMVQQLHPATYIPLFYLIQTQALKNNSILALVDKDAVATEAEQWNKGGRSVPMLDKYLNRRSVGLDSWAYEAPSVSSKEQPKSEMVEEITPKEEVEAHTPKVDVEEEVDSSEKEQSVSDVAVDDAKVVEEIDYSEHTSAPVTEPVKEYTWWQRFKMWFGFNP